LAIVSSARGELTRGVVATRPAPALLKLARPSNDSSRPDREQQLAVRSTQPLPQEVADLIKEHSYHEGEKARAGEYWGGVLAKARAAHAREQLRTKHTPAAPRQTPGDTKYASRDAAEAWANEVSSVRGTDGRISRKTPSESSGTDDRPMMTRKTRAQQVSKHSSRVVLHLSASEREAAESQKAAARAWAEEVSAVTEAGGDLEATFGKSDREQKLSLPEGQQSPQRKLPDGHGVPESLTHKTHTEAALSAADAAKARAWAEVRSTALALCMPL
jgi:hypothetical protein